jgi:photosystem II stability/assembly factor-like uncharacterized protein
MFKKIITSVKFTLSAVPVSNRPMSDIFKSSICLYNRRAILVVLFIMMLSSSAFPQWIRTNGPEGVAISSLSNIDGTIYAGTKVNGIYVSTDDGINWAAMNTGIETLEVTSIVNKPGHIFAGTFGGGVCRSTDGGQTWIAPSNGENLAVISMVVDDDYIFAGTVSNGVYRSSDNGVTWEQKISVFLGYGAMCKSGNKVIASSSNYTLESTDHGENWTYITQLDGAEIFCYYTEGNTIYAGGRNKIYKSTDNGNNFTTIDLNFPFSIVNIYSITSIGSTLFAATSYDGVYESTDSGLNWSSANIGMGPKDVRAITATNSSTLLAGTNYVGLYRSTDLGSSWNKSIAGFLAGSNILSLLDSEPSVYAGTRDGIYRTDDDGDNWMKLTGTNDTINYCTVWGMCEKDGDIYAGTFLRFNSTVYKSIDKGSTWTRSGTGLPSDLSFIFSMVTSGNNILASTDEGVYYSSNDGANWNLANIPTLYIPGLAAGADNFVYAAVPSIGVYRSEDNGVNWIPVLQSPAIDYVEVAAFDNFAFAGSFFAGARHSSNNGSTWFESSGFPADASVFALGPAGDDMVLAGTDLAPSWIYASFDNGVSFSPYSEGLADRASVEAIAVNDTFMFAGTDDHGVWRRLRPGIVSVENQQDLLQAFHLTQNYPNPFNPTTTIKYSILSEEFVTLRVYNAIGEEIRTLVNEIKEAGNYEFTFNAENLASGIYYYRLNAGEFSANKKMILIK